MTGPVEYLKAAHGRAEELARAATSGPWRAEEHAEHGFRVGTADGSSWVAWTGAFDDEPESSRPDSVFIAANSPDKVLARIEAERAVLEACDTVLSGWYYGESKELAHDVVAGLAAGWGWEAPAPA